MIDIEAAGFNVIFVDTFYDYNENCRAKIFSVADLSNCYGRSTMDIAARIEELAVFLGSDVDQEALNQQKQAVCEASIAFTDAMEKAHEKGLRVKVSWLGISQDSETGTSYAELSDYDPTELWFPRTMEELGMPLLHGDVHGDYVGVPASAYFNNCSSGIYNEDCNANTLFPVDFWLFDSRGTQLIDDNFKLIFPDRAVLADQWWYVPKNDGPISYKSIASYLSGMTPRIAAAEKLHNSSETCTPVDPREAAHLIADPSGGLPMNGLVCYNRDLIQKEYLKCPDISSPTDSNPVAPTATNIAPSPVAPAPTGTSPTPVALAPTAPAPVSLSLETPASGSPSLSSGYLMIVTTMLINAMI